MKTRLIKLIGGFGIIFMLVFSIPATAVENDEFSYFTAELVKHDLDDGAGNEAASGPSIRFSKSLNSLFHIRSEFTSLGFDDIELDQKTLELGVGYTIFNTSSNNLYLVASFMRDESEGNLASIGNFKVHANYYTATAGYRIKSERGIEGIFELKHLQPDDDTLESGQKLEVGLRIYPPANDDISLGIRINAFESGERSGDTQDLRLFLRMNF